MDVYVRAWFISWENIIGASAHALASPMCDGSKTKKLVRVPQLGAHRIVHI